LNIAPSGFDIIFRTGNWPEIILRYDRTAVRIEKETQKRT